MMPLLLMPDVVSLGSFMFSSSLICFAKFTVKSPQGQQKLHFMGELSAKLSPE